MKKLIIVLMVVLFVFIGCVENSDETQRVQTEILMKEVNSRIGIPAIKNFQEKKLAKMIFELRDKSNLVCFAYLKSEYTGKLIFIGKCIGYGLPYSVQYTNPMKRMHVSYVIPQADPNGLFMPSGLSATWVMLIDGKGKARPVYIESDLIISPFKLTRGI